MDPRANPKWTKAEEVLKQSMEKEIELMREILSNMVQEEASFLNQNKAQWEELMQNRFHLVEQVKIFRQDRMNATNKLLAISGEKNFEKILSDGADIACDVIFLLDNLISLSEKINSQNTRNQVLSKESQHFIAIPLSISYPQQRPTLPKAQGRKKFLMTIP